MSTDCVCTDTSALGIILGSGFDASYLNGKFEERIVETPFGSVHVNEHRSSGANGINTPVFFVMRHHSTGRFVCAHDVNHKANIWALCRVFKCKSVIAFTSCGSMCPVNYPVGSVTLPVDFINFFARTEDTTYYGLDNFSELRSNGEAYCFAPVTEASLTLRDIVRSLIMRGTVSGETISGYIYFIFILYLVLSILFNIYYMFENRFNLFHFHENTVSDKTPMVAGVSYPILFSDKTRDDGCVYGQMPGPRFETVSEIRLMKNAGCSLVGMTGATEWGLVESLGARICMVSTVDNLARGISSDKCPGSLTCPLQAYLENIGDSRKMLNRLVMLFVDEASYIVNETK